MNRNQLLNICMFFLQLEERALLDRRPGIAQFARKMYVKYRFKLEKEKKQSHGNATAHKK